MLVWVLSYQVKPSKDTCHEETSEKYCDGEGVPLVVGLKSWAKYNFSLVILQPSVQVHAKESSDKHPKPTGQGTKLNKQGDLHQGVPL